MKALIALAVLVMSSPLLAAAGQDGAQNSDESRMVCRHIRTRKSETRMGMTRVCHTRTEWQRIQENGAGTADQSTLFHDTRPVITELGRSNRPN